MGTYTAKMSKGTTIKESIAKWEEREGKKAAETTEVGLYAQHPPIEKMDASLSTLAKCEKLSLSTNAIEKIANLNGLKHLRILSLGRNNIKSLTGLEAVGDTLEELKGINVLKKMKVLYMSNNLVKDWNEFGKLADLTCLENLLFVGNPLEETHTPDGTWRENVATKLKKLKKLDGVPVIRDEEGEED